MEDILDPAELYKIINKQQETIEKQNRQINEQRIRLEATIEKNEELDEEADNLIREIAGAYKQITRILKIEKKEEAIADQLKQGLNIIEELFEKITYHVSSEKEKDTLELQIEQIMVKLEKLRQIEMFETEADKTNEWKTKYEEQEEYLEKIVEDLRIDNEKGAQDIRDFEELRKEIEEKKKAKQAKKDAAKSIKRTGSEPSSSKSKK